MVSIHRRSEAVRAAVDGVRLLMVLLLVAVVGAMLGLLVVRRGGPGGGAGPLLVLGHERERRGRRTRGARTGGSAAAAEAEDGGVLCGGSAKGVRPVRVMRVHGRKVRALFDLDGELLGMVARGGVLVLCVLIVERIADGVGRGGGGGERRGWSGPGRRGVGHGVAGSERGRARERRED